MTEDTGDAEADRVIARLMSADPDFDDCQDAALLIRRLVVDIRGPDGYPTWKEAAIAERVKQDRLRAGLEKLRRDISWNIEPESWPLIDPRFVTRRIRELLEGGE